MNCGSLLLDQELSKIWVFLVEPVLYPFVLEVMCPVLETLSVEWVDLPGLSSLGLLDVSHVGPAEDHESSENECEPPLSLVVEPVWFVPVWELPNVLVSVWGFVSWLLVSWKVWVHVLLRDIQHCCVSAGVRVGIVKPVQSSSTHQDRT